MAAHSTFCPTHCNFQGSSRIFQLFSYSLWNWKILLRHITVSLWTTVRMGVSMLSALDWKLGVLCLKHLSSCPTFLLFENGLLAPFKNSNSSPAFYTLDPPWSPLSGPHQLTDLLSVLSRLCSSLPPSSHPVASRDLIPCPLWSGGSLRSVPAHLHSPQTVMSNWPLYHAHLCPRLLFTAFPAALFPLACSPASLAWLTRLWVTQPHCLLQPLLPFHTAILAIRRNS